MSDPVYVPELDRRQYKIRSYIEKKRTSWYESLGPAKEEIFKHHINVNLLHDYESEQRVREKEKVLEEKKRILIEQESILKHLIDQNSEDVTVRLINETELKTAERQRKEIDLQRLQDARDVLLRSLTSQQLLLKKVLNCKRFIESVVEGNQDTDQFEIDFQKLFFDYEERLKCRLLEISVKNIELQKLSKERRLTVEHWHGDIEDLKKRHYNLSSQIKREQNRVGWLKQTLASLGMESDASKELAGGETFKDVTFS